MPRLSLPALAVVGALVATPSASAATFPQGVAAGDATTTTARLWTRAAQPGHLTLRVSSRSDLRHPVAVRHVTARRASDGAVTATVRHLRPGHRYFFRFFRGRHRSALGRFETAPSAHREAGVRFGVTAGLDPAYDVNFDVVRHMARQHNDFNVLLGDTILSGAAKSLSAKRELYSKTLAQRPLRDLRAGAGLYATWGAGEFAPGFAPAGNASRALYRNGRRAFEENLPVVSRSRTGLYRTVRWGRALELFILDERSFRSAPVGAPECVSPSSGALDPAPTMPSDTRSSYQGFYQQLSAPVSTDCLAALRSSKRTMLGRAQLAQFKRDINRSSARFKVVLSEAPLSQFYFLPYDRWEGYEAEREQVVDYLRDNVDNVLVLSAGGAGGVTGNVRVRTLEPPGVSESGFDDVGVGPAAAPTFHDALEAALGPGTGDVTSKLFLHRAPPYGAGMRCAATNVLSYAEVEVSRNHLTVSLRGLNGKPIVDSDGTPCGPFRLVPSGFTHKPT